MKNNRGFTLIELMIAIAIIGILALVLIPRVGGMKTQTKLTGINTNMNVAEGVVNSLITDYEDTEAGDLETAIQTRLDTGDVNKDPKNPLFPSVIGVDTLTNFNDGDDIPEAAFAINAGDETVALHTTTIDTTIATDLDMAGAILISAYPEDGTLKVKLTPYDDMGRRMDKKEKVISK